MTTYENHVEWWAFSLAWIEHDAIATTYVYRTPF